MFFVGIHSSQIFCGLFRRSIPAFCLAFFLALDSVFYLASGFDILSSIRHITRHTLVFYLHVISLARVHFGKLAGSP